MKTGELVKLRTVEQKDLEQLKNWRNREEFKKHFREYLELNDLNQIEWFENEVNKSNRTIMFSIVDAGTDNLIGCCGLTYINWVYRNADFSFYIGKDDLYIDELGYSIEAAKILLDYAFNQLNLHKIWTEIYEFDNQKKKFLRLLSFNLDAKLREHYFYDGRWWDSLIFSLLKEEFK